MGRSPPPVAGRCPRLAANTGAVFVDGDLEVRFAARATNGSEGSHTRATNCILLRPAPRGQGDSGRPRRRTVLRRACGAPLRGYLGGLFQVLFYGPRG